MKKIIFRILKVILLLIIIAALYLGTVIIYGTITDYKPPLTEKIEPKGNFAKPDTAKTTYTFLTWNIGYCGLGKEMDFFYDGGKKVRPSKELVSKYIKGVSSFLAQNDTMDFVLLQEIDLNSKRSYHANEIDSFAGALKTHGYSYANNYVVNFVPVPYTEPMGKVKAGLIMYSKNQPVEDTRYAFTANYSWPKRLFMLDRCFIFTRYPLKNNKSLVVINTHNEAFDDGFMRKSQMQVLKDIIQGEYKKGNYVVVGGDWNQNPVGYDKTKIVNNVATDVKPSIEKDFLPEGWKWVFDPVTSTNRSNIKSFVRGENETTLIDFFVVSPNISVQSVKGIDLGFENSDHNPVKMTIRLEN